MQLLARVEKGQTDGERYGCVIDVLHVFIDLPQRDAGNERARHGRLNAILPQDNVNGSVDDRICLHLVAMRS